MRWPEGIANPKDWLARLAAMAGSIALTRRAFGAAVAASMIAGCYWGLVASDRYVSESHVIIQRTDLSGGQTMDFVSILGNAGGVNGTDQMLLRDHLLSVDMLQKLDARLDLRDHYSNWRRDPLSRMWSRDASLERFHDYYRSRVSVEYDSYGGVLVIKAQAFDSKTAHDIASALVEEGERYMNGMAHRLAEEQVSFLEKQVAEMSVRAERARQSVLAFQNRKGMVSPEGTAENLVGIVNALEARLAELQTRRGAMLGYLMPENPNVVDIDLQIAAVDKQLSKQRARLASPSRQALNETVEEYQRLQLNAQFAEDVYKTALVALEKGRVEATRTLRMVSVLQQATLPEYPLEPRRLYNMFVFVLLTMLLAGVVELIGAIIRDHQD